MVPVDGVHGTRARRVVDRRREDGRAAEGRRAERRRVRRRVVARDEGVGAAEGVGPVVG